jgi:hypothetical protein
MELGGILATTSIILWNIELPSSCNTSMNNNDKINKNINDSNETIIDNSHKKRKYNNKIEESASNKEINDENTSIVKYKRFGTSVKGIINEK